MVEQGDADRVPASSRRPRLEDVAALVGVSTASVSLVLRGEAGPSADTRRRVLAAATELGYRPDRAASLLARRRTHLLGVLIDISSSFHAEIVTHLHEVAERHGYDIVLSTTTRTRFEKQAIETLIDSRCEALVLLGPESTKARLGALARDLPVVVIGRRATGADVDVVRAADDKGVGLAVDHLVGLGHATIAYLDGGRGTIASDRRRGYRRAMRRHGLRDMERVIAGDHTEESGLRAAALLLEETSPPTAVITYNDRGALGLLDAVTRTWLDVPAGLSVVGYDDSPAAQLTHINLTTVSQDAEQQAERAVAAAVDRLEGHRREAMEVVLAPRLVVRSTTGPPRRLL